MDSGGSSETENNRAGVIVGLLGVGDNTTGGAGTSAGVEGAPGTSGTAVVGLESWDFEAASVDVEGSTADGTSGGVDCSTIEEEGGELEDGGIGGVRVEWQVEGSTTETNLWWDGGARFNVAAAAIEVEGVSVDAVLLSGRVTFIVDQVVGVGFGGIGGNVASERVHANGGVDSLWWSNGGLDDWGLLHAGISAGGRFVA